MSKKEKYGYRETFPRFYRADFELQQKVGTGALDADSVAKAQQYLDSVSVDVAPQIREMLTAMQTAMAEARKLSYDREEFLPAISKPLMDIKSISGMFHEMMVCRVAAFVLTFIEDVRKLDIDVLDILDAFVRVARTLLDMKIRDETNEHGQSFLAEIRAACKRYYDKQAAAKGG
ncbi:MAG: hypothetical protein H6865_00100 [Rhodospirillales bacterium]|nr:hypothetical protein [Alphaproteobacteria bacterium]MCB9986026.1 hypothetical protein [Rhodospirillales bacterium]USO07400.1 MAG: hypothetical protein H6866_08270 [Rhodospirillales bacterium]